MCVCCIVLYLSISVVLYCIVLYYYILYYIILCYSMYILHYTTYLRLTVAIQVQLEDRRLEGTDVSK